MSIDHVQIGRITHINQCLILSSNFKNYTLARYKEPLDSDTLKRSVVCHSEQWSRYGKVIMSP